jgi:uncharacterized protein YggE
LRAAGLDDVATRRLAHQEKARSMMETTPTPVQPGILRVDASVSVRYEIAPVKK